VDVSTGRAGGRAPPPATAVQRQSTTGAGRTTHRRRYVAKRNCLLRCESAGGCPSSTGADSGLLHAVGQHVPRRTRGRAPPHQTLKTMKDVPIRAASLRAQSGQTLRPATTTRGIRRSPLAGTWDLESLQASVVSFWRPRWIHQQG